ncbi:MAG: FtsL-like putative cell division protein [Crocinitomicaceae bacterium]
MENEYLDKEQQSAKETSTKKAAKKKKKKKQSLFVQILNGDILSKEFIIANLNFIFFVIFLLLLVIGKGYYGKQLVTDIAKEQNELDELTSDFVEAKARLEENTRRIKLVKELESTGLKETENPTKVIKVKK